MEINEAPPLLYNEPVFGASILSVLIFHSTRAAPGAKIITTTISCFYAEKKFMGDGRKGKKKWWGVKGINK